MSRSNMPLSTTPSQSSSVPSHCSARGSVTFMHWPQSPAMVQLCVPVRQTPLGWQVAPGQVPVYVVGGGIMPCGSA